MAVYGPSVNKYIHDMRRYEFFSNITSLFTTLVNIMNQELYGDIHWTWTYYNNNQYAVPTAWNNPNNKGSNMGTITIANRYDPNLFFTLCLNYSVHNTYYGTFPHCYVLRVGLFNNGSDVKPDLYTDVGANSEIPFHTCNPNTVDSNELKNINYKWNVFTTKNFVFLFGEPQDNSEFAYPFRLYLGKLRPFEQEDPTISSDFVGVFSHFPSAFNQGDSYYHLRYNCGRGYVRKARNGTKYALYNLVTSSQITSPGLGGRFFISPFYVFQPNEGVRGEFYGLRTAVLRSKDVGTYPDGSVLDLGTERYYVFHVNDQPNPSTHQGWRDTSGGYHYGQPVFFDSPMLMGGGQRVLLFELNKGV